MTDFFTPFLSAQFKPLILNSLLMFVSPYHLIFPEFKIPGLQGRTAGRCCTANYPILCPESTALHSTFPTAASHQWGYCQRFDNWVLSTAVPCGKWTVLNYWHLVWASFLSWKERGLVTAHLCSKSKYCYVLESYLLDCRCFPGKHSGESIFFGLWGNHWRIWSEDQLYCYSYIVQLYCLHASHGSIMAEWHRRTAGELAAHVNKLNRINLLDPGMLLH